MNLLTGASLLALAKSIYYNWYSAKKKTMWFIGVEVEQETSAPPPKKILDPPLIMHLICPPNYA